MFRFLLSSLFCLILQKDDTSNSLFSKWKGPARIIEVKSPYSYLVEYNGTQYHLHANKLRKFKVQADSAECNNVMYVTPEIIDENVGKCNCSIVYESDSDFGNITVVEPEVFSKPVLLPSQKIESDALHHLTKRQRQEYLSVLDKYPEVFSDIPGFCDIVEHEVPLVSEFKPKRLRAYKVPENFKEEVSKQIQELLHLGFIEPSTSAQVSPLVCVLKPKDKYGKRSVRTCIDYRYVNRYTKPSANTLEDISEIIQQVGNAKYISKFDAKSGYHQCPVKPEDRWLTAFVYDSQVYQWCRVPFGMVGSGSTFVRALRQVLNPIRKFTKNYVDDMAVHSDSWTRHLSEVDQYLSAIKQSGFTLNLPKCEFAKSSIKFVGHIIGSGKRSVDPDKVFGAVSNLKEPESKKQLRQILGFFSFWREYIRNFSEIAKPLTDLTAQRIPERISFQQKERDALNTLKQRLCDAVNNPLNIIDMSKPFSVFVDASDFAVGACLSQPSDGREQPVAFASCKFTSTQQNWATIVKEAYAVLWALQKFRHWIFGRPVTVYSDHNPLTFLTETTPKSAKLMRWALALQEYDITFRYCKGILNVAADCLSRNVNFKDDGS